MPTTLKMPMPSAAGKRAIGRGLDALLNDARGPVDGKQVLQLPIEQIRPDARQPRREFDPDAIAELARSIAQQGLLQPVLVRRDGRGVPTDRRRASLARGPEGGPQRAAGAGARRD